MLNLRHHASYKKLDRNETRLTQMNQTFMKGLFLWGKKTNKNNDMLSPITYQTET